MESGECYESVEEIMAVVRRCLVYRCGSYRMYTIEI